MGIWIDSNGEMWNINIGHADLAMIQKNPDFRFCWIEDNPGIDDENNSDFYHEVNMTNKVDNKTYQELKEKITVNCADGSSIIGRVYHWVMGPCSGTPLKNWFILCTKDYPYN